MNPYQKAGVWIMRLVGTVVAVVGASGPIYAALAKALGQHIQEYPAEKEAQGKTKGTRAAVIPVPFTRGKADQTAFTPIEFDVAVTVTDSAEKKGGGGITVAGFFSVEGGGQRATENISVRRIKFTIPVNLPEQD